MPSGAARYRHAQRSTMRRAPSPGQEAAHAMLGHRHQQQRRTVDTADVRSSASPSGRRWAAVWILFVVPVIDDALR